MRISNKIRTFTIELKNIITNKQIMRKFYSFIATLMLLVVGSGNAWADSWSINFKGLVSSNADVVISSTETVTIGGTELGTISYNDVAVDSKFVIQTGT